MYTLMTIGMAIICLVIFGCDEANSSMIGTRKRIEQKINFKNVGEAEQIVLVTNRSWKDIHATLTGYEKRQNEWQKVFGPFPAVIGKSGFAIDKHEGDGTSPAGVFPVGPFFGSSKEPDGLKFSYRQITGNDFWVDDPESAFYNTWQTGPANGRWKSAEELILLKSQYKFAAVIQYNIPPVAGKGSAVFFHLWSNGNTPTAGCIAMEEANVLRVLRWLDPEKKPVFVQGPKEFIERYRVE